MSNPPLSGMMHVWLMAKAAFAGRTYLSLRGVNWDAARSYDARHPGAVVGAPFWHVPTVKFPFDPPSPPSARVSADRALAIAAREWPALSAASLMRVDQNLTGSWGWYAKNPETGVLHPEAVTRVMLDFGSVSQLPLVQWMPGQTLRFARHPVAWVCADDIVRGPRGQGVMQGAQSSVFVVRQPQTVPMEVLGGDFVMMRADQIVFQKTIATMFMAGGVTFSRGDVSDCRPQLSPMGLTHT